MIGGVKVKIGFTDVGYMTEGFIQVLTTTSDREDAVEIAEVLVEEELAACVQISSEIQSIYRWQGDVEDASEFLLQIKTRGSLFEEVEERISELHPYETPEITALPFVDGSGSYLEWMDEQIKST